MIAITTTRAMIVRRDPEPPPPLEAAWATPLVDKLRGVCSPVAPVAACAIGAYESVRAPRKSGATCATWRTASRE